MSSRNRRELYLNRSRQCPSCKKIPLNFIGEGWKCSRCEKYGFKEIEVCRFCDLKLCERCVDEYPENIQEKKNMTQQSKTKCSLIFIPFGVLILVLLYALCFNLSGKEISGQVLTPIDNLHSYFPSQTKDTWRHICSILDPKFPTVKSLTLLHGKDDKTTECLVSKLIMVYTNNNNIKIEDVSFKNVSEEVNDYGELLEYYRPIVEKHRIFVTDLNKVPGNIARIFHSLCDEGSSPIKPSLFIFILRNNENVKHLKPFMRATTILQESWQDLPTNELFPLLSRVVKNVIDVTPEKHIKC